LDLLNVVRPSRPALARALRPLTNRAPTIKTQDARTLYAASIFILYLGEQFSVLSFQFSVFRKSKIVFTEN
jgi:hypothetical protein